MTDQPPFLQAPHTALLVMDYQAGIVDRVPQSDELIERAQTALALVRNWGGQIGYVRVAFEGEDFDVPDSSRMGALLRGSGQGGTSPGRRGRAQDTRRCLLHHRPA
jgi:nicotinamidase-related amidase